MIKRLFFIDALRGFFILCMIFYHLIFDLSYFYNISFVFYDSIVFDYFAKFVRMGFLVVVGFSARIMLLNALSIKYYRHKMLKRFFYLLAIALGISLVMYAFAYDPIYFGILHLIAFIMLLFISITNIYWFLLFLIANLITAYYVDFWATVLFLKPISFSMGDFYYIYWIIPALIGYYLFEYLLKFFNEVKKRFLLLEYLGQKSLIIYLVHQPVILSILYIIYRLTPLLKA